MTFDIQSRPKLAAIAAACLLTVALPSNAALAKDKIKTPDAPISAPVTAAPTAMPEVSVDIASINAVGSNVDDATLRAIFSGKVIENADALAGLTATSITIPQIVTTFSTQTAGQASTGTMTISDIVLDNVVDGVAASVSLGGAKLTSSEDVSGSFGAVSAANLDIGGVLRLYRLVDAPEQTELRTIYTDFKAAGGSVQTKDVSCTFGAMDAASFKARPLKYSFADVMGMSRAIEAEGETLSPQTIGLVMRVYADIFTAFESSPVAFDGFGCTGTDENGTPLDFSLASMTMDGMTPGTYPAITMNGFKVSVPGNGEINIGSMAMKTIDLSGPIAAVASAPATIDPAWLEANMRKLIPAFGGFSISDLSMDIPNPDAPSQRVKANIGAFDMTLADYRNGIPTNVSTTGSKIVVDLPTDTDDEQLNQLIALGIKSIDFGFAVKSSRDEATSTVNIEDVSVDGVDLGHLGLSGTLGNVTDAFFDADSDTALAAAMGVVVKNLKVDVTDAGLSDIILASISAEQGSDAATMRPVYAGLAEGTIIGMLAGAAEAQKVGKAVSAFITGDAKALTIEMTAKDPAGLGMADFTAAEQDPTVLIGKTNITATAK